MQQEKVDKFKEIMFQTYVASMIDDSAEGQITANIYDEMGFIDFLYTNVFKLELDSDDLADYIHTHIKVSEIFEELNARLGESTNNMISQQLQEKTFQWTELNKEEIYTKLAERVFGSKE